MVSRKMLFQRRCDARRQSGEGTREALLSSGAYASLNSATSVTDNAPVVSPW